MSWLNISIFIIVLAFVISIFYKQRLLVAFSIFTKAKLNHWQVVLLWVCSFVLFLTLWGFFSGIEQQGINKIPSPIQTVTAACRLLISGKLIEEASISCLRIVVGFSIASIIGVLIGLFAGSFLLAKQLIQPVNSFLRYIPPTAFISLLIVYFGIGESYKYAVIFFGVIFFIIQMVIDAVEDLDTRYMEMALTTGYSNWKTFKEVVIPASLPRIWDVLRINLSASWTFLVAAELIGAQKGLGHLISISQRYLRIDELFVGILAFGVIGIFTDKALEFSSKVFFRWHYLSLRQ